MTDTSPQPAQPRKPVTPQGRGRRIAQPGAQVKRRRVSLLVLGLVLVLGAGAGFWFILQSVDQRQTYMVAARDIQRWDIVGAADFIPIEANLGDGRTFALPPNRIGLVNGKWATGRIPAGTFVTLGMFEEPPMSNEAETDKVLLQVSLPAGEAPLGTLRTGEKVALLGEEGSGAETAALPELGLIGVLTLEQVQGDNLYYIVSPREALDIKSTIDRFNRAGNRVILKLGFTVDRDVINQAFEEYRASRASTIPDGAFGDIDLAPLPEDETAPDPQQGDESQPEPAPEP